MKLAIGWRSRALTGEAAALLALARILISAVPFRRWRGSLGVQVAPRCDAAAIHQRHRDARRLTKAVLRAAHRLPGETRCLAQAMALAWMLRRRRMECALVLGVRRGMSRGSIADLHAWVVRDGETLIGEDNSGYVPVIGFA